MMLTLEALQILDTIARQGSFAAAAEALQRTPSALTYSVRKLEEDLDVLLFDRRGYRAQLTAAGRELLEQGRSLLAAAAEVERRVQRTARGWEVELRLAIDNVVAFEKLLPLIQEFEETMPGTRLRFAFEVLTGVWEALLDGRADIVLGTAAGGPEILRSSGVFQMKAVASVEWIFAIAPAHPLAQAQEPLESMTIQAHRVIAVGDSARNLPTSSFGLLSGQEVLTVPCLQDKLQAQLAGLGCGHLPRHMAAQFLARGLLVEKQTLQAKPPDTLHLGWRKTAQGKCTRWFVQKFSDPACWEKLFS
ncbi:LysR substrate-binding domain-containing protein [Massilia sp. W12]|uniref:LysR substrate-binding domain-containing protein n=1 Tax=Massilia sp. W12 TaxID=3126507 RepID=UPI0030D254C5